MCVLRKKAPSVTYVDVDTVSTAQGNIVTHNIGVGGWGPTEHNRRLVLNF